MTQVYHTDQSPQPRRRKKQFPPAKPGYKFCYDCEQELPFEAFPEYRGKPFSYCRDCSRKRDALRSRPYEVPPEARRYNPRNKTHLLPTQEGHRFCNACEQEKSFEAFRHAGGKPIAVCIGCERERDRMRSSLRRTRKSPPLPKATEPGYKVCNTCLQEKRCSDNLEESGFSKDPTYQDGFHGRCRQCCADRWAKRPKEEVEEQRQRRSQLEEARREDIRAYDRQRYHTTNRKAQKCSHDRERHARINGVYAEVVDYDAIIARDGYACYICSQPITEEQEMAFDHIIPLLPRAGDPYGTHTADNLSPVHRCCNARKSNIPFDLLTPFQRRGPD